MHQCRRRIVRFKPPVRRRYSLLDKAGTETHAYESQGSISCGPSTLLRGIEDHLSADDATAAFRLYQKLGEEKRLSILKGSTISAKLIRASISDRGRTKEIPSSLQLLSELQREKLSELSHFFAVIFDEIAQNRLEEAKSLLEILPSTVNKRGKEFAAARLLMLIAGEKDFDAISNNELLAAISPAKVLLREVREVIDAHSIPTDLRQKCLRAMQKLSPINSAAHKRLIENASRARNQAKLIKLYQASLLEIETMSEATFAVYIAAFFRCGLMDEAMSAWNDMVKGGTTPGSASWSAMLEGAQGRRSAALVKELWQKMINAGVQPDSVLHTVYIDSLFAAGDFTAALKAFEELRGTGLANQVTTNVVIKGILRANKDIPLRQILQMFEDQGLQADIWTFNTLLHGLMTGGRMNDVTTVFQLMEKAEIAPDVVTYTMVLDGLFKQRQAPSAETIHAVLRDMGKNGIEQSTHSYTVLIDGLLKSHKNITATKVLLQEMKTRGIPLNVVTYTSLIQGFMDMGDAQAARSAWKEMQAHNIRPDTPTWNCMIDGFGVLGQIKLMMEFYSQMRSPKSTITPNKYTYSYVLNALAQANERELAQQVVNDMAKAEFRVESDGLRDAVQRVVSLGVDAHRIPARAKTLRSRI